MVGTCVDVCLLRQCECTNLQIYMITHTHTHTHTHVHQVKYKLREPAPRGQYLAETRELEPLEPDGETVLAREYGRFNPLAFRVLPLNWLCVMLLRSPFVRRVGGAGREREAWRERDRERVRGERERERERGKLRRERMCETRSDPVVGLAHPDIHSSYACCFCVCGRTKDTNTMHAGATLFGIVLGPP